MTTPAKGAATSIHVVTSPTIESGSGQYFVKSGPVQSSAASYDEAVQERLWAVSLKQATQKF